MYQYIKLRSVKSKKIVILTNVALSVLLLVHTLDIMTTVLLGRRRGVISRLITEHNSFLPYSYQSVVHICMSVLVDVNIFVTKYSRAGGHLTLPQHNKMAQRVVSTPIHETDVWVEGDEERRGERGRGVARGIWRSRGWMPNELVKVL